MHLRQEGNPFFNGEPHQRQIHFAEKEIKLTVSRPCAEISVDTRPKARSRALHMAHLDLAQGPGEPRRPLRDGSGSLNIPHSAGSIARMKDEGRKMKAEDSQQTISRELQPKNRQVNVVYKRSNFAGKPPFLATFGDARRAFQPAIQAQHVVAAT
jgi:hypothetical protein